MSNPLPPQHNLIATGAANSGMDGLNQAVLAAGVTLEGLSVDENGRTGSETTFAYTGSYSAIKIQQSWCRGWGAYNMSLRRQPGGTLWNLSAMFPWNEYSTESNTLLFTNGTYELDVEMNQPSVYANPKLRGTFNSAGVQITAGLLPDNYIATVARIVENFEAGQYAMTTGGVTDGGWALAVADVKAAIASNVSPTYYQNRALQLFATVAAHKTDAFIEYTHVFKRTLTAALPIQVQASNIGKGQVFTTFEMASLENVNPNGFFQLDATSLWMKAPPVISTAARQKTQVSYSYSEFKQANGLLYFPYNSAVLQYASPTDLPPGV